MVRRQTGRLAGFVVCTALAALGFGVRPASAQSLLQGSVTDASGKPIEDAQITIEAEGNHYTAKTDKKGEFMQIGLRSATYKITATKDKLSASQTVEVRQARPTPVKLVLGAAPAGAPNPAAALLRKTLDDAAAAGAAGKTEEAIAGYQKAAELNPPCASCFYNIATLYFQKKDYDNAEQNFKKSIELKPDLAEAYSGLASLYNAQRKFDLAATASAKATELSGAGAGSAGGGNADALFNQGVILWNGGKIADAKKAFQSAIAANPNHAEAHYQLGMALVNEGNLAAAASEFETYVKLAPEGPNAATAKSLMAQLKK
jgi:tetratricopeptide (TPR) repeat protein